MAMIRKQYATPILAEEMNKIISEQLGTVYPTGKTGNPRQPYSTDEYGILRGLGKTKFFTFAYEIGLAQPLIDLRPKRKVSTAHH